MTDPGEPVQQPEVRADLVQYLIVSVADVDGLDSIGAALAGLVEAGALRVLDLVAVVCDHDGDVVVWEPEAVPSLAALTGPGGRRGLLSEHDIELSSLALAPGTAGIVVVTEDRWAEPLSRAAQEAGGRIVAGDRVPPERIAALLADRPKDTDEGD